MNRKILLTLGIVAVLMSTSVIAYPRSYHVSIPLLSKDPSTWDVLPKYHYDEGKRVWNHNPTGMLVGRQGRYVRAYGWNLVPYTNYTLIYYGDETHNDVWPYATCVTEATNSSWQGRMSAWAEFDYRSFVDDGIGHLRWQEPSDPAYMQKFWLIPSSDVDCEAGRMTAWNPTEYMFEHHTI